MLCLLCADWRGARKNAARFKKKKKKSSRFPVHNSISSVLITLARARPLHQATRRLPTLHLTCCHLPIRCVADNGDRRLRCTAVLQASCRHPRCSTCRCTRHPLTQSPRWLTADCSHSAAVRTVSRRASCINYCRHFGHFSRNRALQLELFIL